MSTAIPADEDVAVARFRQLLGEDDQENSSFNRDELVEILVRHTDLEGAAMDAWGIKASRYANLVDVSEGSTSRKYSSLRQGALAMVEFYAARTDEGGVVGPGVQAAPTTYQMERY